MNYIIFDKTGTLTKDEQGLVEVATTGMTNHEAVSIAAGIESDSEHIIAQAIRSYAQSQNIKPTLVNQFEGFAGCGAKTAIDGNTYFVGGPRLLEQQG